MVESETVFGDHPVFGLRRDTVHRPDHPDDTHARLVVEHPGAVVVLAVDDQERVCCLRQYRHAGQGWFVELPAGLKDAAGEDPRDTAARELREEAELQASDWRLLLDLVPSAGILEERQQVFLARGLSPVSRGDFELHGEEAEMELFWTPVDELVGAALAGRISESPLVAAVLAYTHLRREGRL
ncbi:NUDIX hydrolase [Nocardioides marmoraquaticus]